MCLLLFVVEFFDVSFCRWLRANRQKVWDSNPTCRGPRDLGGKPVEDMTFEDLCDGQWASMVKLTPRVPIRWFAENIVIGNRALILLLLYIYINIILYCVGNHDWFKWHFLENPLSSKLYYCILLYYIYCLRQCACADAYCFFCF